MNVLSLFDGISCGRVALERAGVKVNKYFASEIEKSAIKVSQSNWPDIIQVGDVCKVSFKDGVLHTEFGNYEVGQIDLLIAGSPCQGFSLAGKQLAFDDPRSKLYFEFERLLKEISPRWFFLENVRMKQEYKDTITSRIGVEPVAINSTLVSAQNRYRLYWSNLVPHPPKDKGIVLADILETNPDSKYNITRWRLKWLESYGEVKQKGGYVAFNPTKAKCLTVRCEPSWNTTYIVQRPHGTNSGGLRAEDGKTPTLTTSSWEHNNILISQGLVRKLTPIECERLQTLPDGYTAAVSDNKRYAALGNCWTVDVVVSFFEQMKGME